MGEGEEGVEAEEVVGGEEVAITTTAGSHQGKRVPPVQRDHAYIHYMWHFTCLGVLKCTFAIVFTCLCMIGHV